MEETATLSSSVRRPRNREVTSRYKSTSINGSSISPNVIVNRRYPTPHVDRGGHTLLPDVSKRAISADRRKSSPTRNTCENRICYKSSSVEDSPSVSENNGISSYKISSIPNACESTGSHKSISVQVSTNVCESRRFYKSSSMQDSPYESESKGSCRSASMPVSSDVCESKAVKSLSQVSLNVCERKSSKSLMQTSLNVCENKGAKSSLGQVPPTAPPRRANPSSSDMLWPSTRSLSSSMIFEPRSLPPNGQAKRLSNSQSKSLSDQTLRPSANVVPRTSDTRKPTPERKIPPERKSTPERKTTPRRSRNADQAENAKPQENVHKVEPRVRPTNAALKLSGAAMSRSVDLSMDREKPLGRVASQAKPTSGGGGGYSSAPRSMSTCRARQSSLNEGQLYSSAHLKTRSESRTRRPESPLRMSKGSNKDSSPSMSTNSSDFMVLNAPRHAGQAIDLASSELNPINPPIDNASDTESVSSGGTTTTTSSSGWGTPGNVSVTRVRATAVPARFLKDATARSRRLLPDHKVRTSMPEGESPLTLGSRTLLRCKTSESPQGSVTSHSNGSLSSSPWSVMANRSMSGLMPSQQPHSPLKCSPYRSITSPLRSRGVLPMVQSQRTSSAALMLNFGADIRKGKRFLSQVEEIHLLRILHNRLLQWRFVNARAEGAMKAQSIIAEKSLYNVCVRISDLRSSVAKKKTKLQQARQAQKLNALLSVQVPMLEDWSDRENEHSIAVNGVVKALDAAVLRVPVTGGAKADALALKSAMSSAFDVMNSLENSVSGLLPKVNKTNSLLSELGFVAARERVLLKECASLLATASALQAEESSIRTHLVQCEHEKARVLGHLMENSDSIQDDSRL